ncbi:MAG: DUF2442 domain-containing protein [Candidatus Rokubacteria bacterium]|nr:DUF2442 domain-containing protein [Candidatus Rokubacteria bacterium]MBI3826591.1 DUF2442 domain-containing protein [Candidatus Rokubacteria bacterium]
MGHPVHKVKAFKIVGPYRIHVEFGDDLVRTIDFEGVLEGELYGPLHDLNQFNAVSLDHEAHTLVWPNGADFDPATLHDWPDHEAAMVTLARRWASAAAAAKKAG